MKVNFFKARLSRHIGFWVIVSVLLIETIILIPSYITQKKWQLEQLEHFGFITVLPIVRLTDSSTTASELLSTAERVTAGSPIIGGAIYRAEDGRLLGKFGEPPDLTYSAMQGREIVRVISQDSLRYDVGWSAAKSQSDYHIIGRLDASSVKKELWAYVGRIILFVILIVAFVTAGTMLAVGATVITPILRLRNDMLTAGNEGSSQNFYSRSVKRNDELGDVMAAFNSMFDQIGSRTAKLFAANEQLQQEIAERKRAEEAAEAANRSKSAFLANMSHELRTPLNAIIGYSEMLIEEAEDLGHEEFVPDVQKIHSSGKHLLVLINNILDLSKVEAGKMELYPETFHIPGMIEDVVSTVQPLVAKNANKLEVNCDDDLDTVHTDLTKLRQVLFNLLSNACKFTEKGTIFLDVTRVLEEGAGWFTFSVRDTGIGMTAEQVAKLFQAFSQVHNPTGSSYGGTGLGLAISKRFCQMMGGDISVVSKPGEGSTFTVKLPADPQIQKEEPMAPSEQRAEPLREEANTVLVIDDDPNVQDLMRRLLSKEGFQVETASAGEEGLKRAGELRPDVITLDVMMPSMDGWAVLSALKADPKLADIPVIMLTIMDSKHMGYTLGASDYLTKPIDRDRLVTILKKYRRDLANFRVLLVEDDAETREILRHTLEKSGCTVTEAGNGRVALEQIAAGKPALILLDLMMPEMDGFQFVAELRKHEKWRSIPVVVITAKDITSEDRLRLSGYVEKILQKETYTSEKLLAEVRDLVVASVRQDATVKA
jgi:signal transduction histidine kinase/CheY-like chemotaxis protein